MKPLPSPALHWSEASKERCKSRKTEGKKTVDLRILVPKEHKGTYFPLTLNEGWAPTSLRFLKFSNKEINPYFDYLTCGDNTKIGEKKVFIFFYNIAK